MPELFKTVITLAVLFFGFPLAVVGFAAWSTGHQEPAAPGRCAVLVLGSQAADDGSLTRSQKARVDWGVEAFRAFKCEVMVLTGGAVGNEHVEAKVMAAEAQRLGVPAKALILETEARNTRENIRLGVPRLKDYATIYLVSDCLHAWRGWLNLRKQFPALSSRVRVHGRWSAMGDGAVEVLSAPIAGWYNILALARDALTREI